MVIGLVHSVGVLIFSSLLLTSCDNTLPITLLPLARRTTWIDVLLYQATFTHIFNNRLKDTGFSIAIFK
jgi:hypothetical protein